MILIDFTGWTIATAPPMKTSRETLSILQDHYPERLAVAVCYNAPLIFALFWKAISPFIDPETYRKIRFVNPKRKKEMRRMRKMFRMEVIDADMGGERDPRFDAAAFARAARARTTREEKRRPREVAVGDEDAGERAERRGGTTRARVRISSRRTRTLHAPSEASRSSPGAEDAGRITPGSDPEVSRAPSPPRRNPRSSPCPSRVLSETYSRYRLAGTTLKSKDTRVCPVSFGRVRCWRLYPSIGASRRGASL